MWWCIEDRTPALVLLHALGEPRQERERELLHALVLLLVVDDDLAGVLAHEVADAAQREVEVGVDQAGGLAVLLAALDLAPQAGEEVDVVAQLLIDRVLGGGAHDEARALRPRRVDDVAQPAPLLVAADALADADLGDVRHEHRVAARQRDVAGDARALETDRILDDLDDDVLSGLQEVLDLAIRELLARARDARGGAFGRLVTVIGLAVLEELALLTCAEHIRDVEERGTLHLRTEIDERRLHSWQDSRDLSPIDVADHSAVALALDKKLRQGTFLDHRHAGLGSLGVHHEHVLHESSAIRCARSGASRHPCRKLGSLDLGSTRSGNTGIFTKQAIMNRPEQLARGLLHDGRAGVAASANAARILI